MNVSKLAPYAKSVVAVIGLMATIAQACIDGTIDSAELGVIITAGAVLAGVYQVPNKQ